MEHAETVEGAASQGGGVWGRVAGLWVVSGVLILMQMICWPAAGHAQGPFLSVRGEPDDCLTREALVRATRRYLGGGTPTGGARIELVVAGEEAGFVVIHRGAEVARRTFTVLPDECRDRRRALGLSMALALESVGLGRLVTPSEAEPEPMETSEAPAEKPPRPRPRRLRPAPEPEPVQEPLAPAPEPEPKPEPEPPPQPEPEAIAAEIPEVSEPTPAAELQAPEPPSSKPSGPPFQLSLSAGGGLLWGLRPDYGGALQLDVDVQWGGLLVDVGGLWAPDVDDGGITSEGGSVVASVLGARLGACYLWRPAGVAVGPCGTVLGGVVRSAGRGFASDLKVDKVWLAASPGLRGHLEFGAGFALLLQVDMLIHLQRPVLVVDGPAGGEIDPGPVGALANLALRWTFQ